MQDHDPAVLRQELLVLEAYGKIVVGVSPVVDYEGESGAIPGPKFIKSSL